MISSSIRLISKSKLSTRALSSFKEHEEFLVNKAKVTAPTRFESLLKIFEARGDQIVSPYQNRDKINPFFIPVVKLKDEHIPNLLPIPIPTSPNSTSSKSKEDLYLSIIRWPTQRPEMELQFGITGEGGALLYSLSCDDLLQRILIEYDAKDKSERDEEVLKHMYQIYSKEVDRFSFKNNYKLNDINTFIESKLKNIQNEEEKKLFVDRYLLLKVGPFIDSYHRLAQNFVNKKDESSALITSEKASGTCYGWGYPVISTASILKQFGRTRESKDTANSALSMPKWTLGQSFHDIEQSVLLAGYSNVKTVGEMHLTRSLDNREREINEENLDPKQVQLDQAAHIMDAIACGVVEGNWNAKRQELADKYKAGGYEDISSFILEV